MINELVSEHFRTDGVNIIIRTASMYVNRNTLEFVSEIPEGAVASEWGKLTARVRKDQTGEIYEIAHDVEGSTNTYTEVRPTPESYSEIRFSMGGTEYIATPKYTLYPEYNASTTYAEGDIVTYERMEYICQEDGTVGIPPNTVGFWGMYMPYVEERNVEWKSLEELSE